MGSDSAAIVFKSSKILTLPQTFQFDLSRAVRFDPSKDYNLHALITDEEDNIYMASLKPVPLRDEYANIIVPVDLLYYVQVHLHSSSKQQFNYISGSTAQIMVTDNPEISTKPIVTLRIDSISKDFREFSLEIPAKAIQRDLNYYIIMILFNLPLSVNSLTILSRIPLMKRLLLGVEYSLDISRYSLIVARTGIEGK